MENAAFAGELETLLRSSPSEPQKACEHISSHLVLPGATLTVCGLDPNRAAEMAGWCAVCWSPRRLWHGPVAAIEGLMARVEMWRRASAARAAGLGVHDLAATPLTTVTEELARIRKMFLSSQSNA